MGAVILLSMVPLLYPAVPPLVDLYGHLGRHRVQVDLADSPWLHLYFGFDWQPIGNLGLDLLLEPLSRLFELELAVKLIVMSIPAMTVAGFLWVAREVHNRIPPTAFFALPFAYGHPFMFGFANFALSMALAFLAFGLWLRLGRLGKTRLRAILFVPISILIFFAHTFGWGALGLLAFSAEAVRQHDRGQLWLKAAFKAALHALVMVLPLIFVIAWRTDGSEGITTDWFNWDAKYRWLKMALRDRWMWFDVGAVVLALLVIAEAFRNPRLGLSRNLAFSALVLLACFLLLPRIIFGSAYADMRLVPYIIAVFLLAIRFRQATHRRTAQVLAVLGVAFFLVRIAGNTASLAITWNDQKAKLEALDHVPMGARVASLVGDACGRVWPLRRNSHLGAMVIVRRHGFSNDQWVQEGLNTLRLRYTKPRYFDSDPSQMVEPTGCTARGAWEIDQALSVFPRAAFDYLWLIDAPPFDAAYLDGMERVWSGSGSSLYRISPAAGTPPPATLQTEAAAAR